MPDDASGDNGGGGGGGGNSSPHGVGECCTGLKTNASMSFDSFGKILIAFHCNYI